MQTVPVVHFTVAGLPDVATTGLERPYTIVFDGTCRMCTRLARLLERWDSDRQLEVVPSQAPGVMARFPWIPARAYAEALQMIGPEGRTWQGAAAIEQLLDILPKGRFLSWLFHVPGLRRIADRIYRWVAQHRYHLGCGEHCVTRQARLAWKEEGEAD